MNDYIIKDQDENIFISLTINNENDLTRCEKLTHCLAVVKLGSDYLFGWNKWRCRWEIFGGCINNGEKARECITRECYEELGIQNVEFEYIGLMKFLMKPDYFSPDERIEYGALYGVSVNNIDVDDIYDKIKDRNEIGKLALYGDIKDVEPIALIDEKLLEYYI